MNFRPTVLALSMALALPATALAFAPTGDVDGDAGAPTRHELFHRTTQVELSEQTLAWLDFSAAHPGWSVRWDELAGTPLRMSGSGIDLGPVDTDASAELAAHDFLDEVRELSRVDPADLRLTHNSATGRLRVVVFQREVAGIPVEGATVQLYFKFGRLVMAGLETHPDVDVSTLPRLSREQALSRARRGIASGARVVDAGKLVILPQEGPEGLVYSLVYKSRLDVDGSAPAQWISYVDAHSGALLYRYNDVHYAFQGTIRGGFEPRTVGDVPATSPFKSAIVSSGRLKSTETNAAGAYNLRGSGSATLTTVLDGAFVRVRNSSGANGSGSIAATSSAPADFAWGYGTTATEAETNAFYHTHLVRDRCLLITPELAVLQKTMTANVNQNGSCNAFYNGSINFYKESTDCNNTGRISDVIYHEYGHHYHQSLVSTGVVDGSIGEGSGDYLSATITNDPNLAPYFFKSGAGIRNIEPDLVYPDDLVGEVHADGLIWGGAMWDLRKRMIAENGYDKGVAITDDLFAKSLTVGPRLSTAYDAVVLADDNDGNLENGTPHFCQITEELGRHGLGPGVRADFLHTDSPVITAGAATTLAVSISSTSSACLSLVPSTARLIWSTSPEGPFQSVALTATSSGYSGVLPAQPSGTLVYYAFTIADSKGVVQSSNKGRSFALYQTYAGTLTPVVCQDFEASFGDYTHALDAGTPGDGADDWMWGTPTGAYGDPGSAGSGTKAWGNDLAPDGYNGAYQGDKVNHLQSPAYVTTGQQSVLLRYRRWLNVEDGANDQATIYVNDTPVWQNEATTGGTAHTEDDRWTWHYIRLNGLADNESSVVLKWELATNNSLEFGGWTLDDVCLFAAQ